MTMDWRRCCAALVFALCLGSAAAAGTPVPPGAPRILTGEHEGAAWRIDVPSDWNGKLIVSFRGNTPEPVKFDQQPYTAGGRVLMLQRGYALVQSGYARADWNIEDAYRDTEWVRRHFSATIGKPTRTYAVGQSMGGLAVAHALEQPDTPYDAGLSLGGTLGGGDALFEQAFANLAAFDYYLPGAIGPLQPVAPETRLDAAAVEKLAAALQEKPDAKRELSLLVGVAPEQLAEQIAINRDMVRRVQQLSGGNAVGNAHYLYAGTRDDAALNAGVRRYASDAKAFDFLRRNYAPSGKLNKPLLALQTVHDPLVSAAATNSYATVVRRAGRETNFVQQYTPGDGHLAFTVDQIVAALDGMIAWAEQGQRPASGLQPAAAAALAAAAAMKAALPPHELFELDSAVLKERRRISVYLPPGYATDSTARFPVLYMPDGGLEEDFPHVAATVDQAIRAGRLRALVIVGIENTQRRRDTTGPTAVASDRAIAPVVGGSAAFRAFIRDELIAQVATRYRVSEDRAIMGESLAGLFVLETCTLEPQLFSTCIALSPSLWWNNAALLATLGERLKTNPDWQARWYFASADEDNIAPLTARLDELLRANAPAGLRWQYQPRPDLRHDTIYRALAPELLPALFSP